MRTWIVAVMALLIVRSVAGETRWLDRSAAPTLARVAARGERAEVQSNVQSDRPELRRVASVEVLERPVLLPAPQRDAAPVVAGKIVVDGAASLRVRVDGAGGGAVLWVAGDEDEAFERFEPSADSTWTPTTRGNTVFVAVEGSEGSLALTAMAVGETETTEKTSCLTSAACIDAEALPELAEASRAIAMIRFVRDGASYVCSGALVSDASNSGAPLFITARHCISTQDEAASIEAVWDYRSPACGSEPSARTSSRTYGAQLLVSSAATDVALLRLQKIPPNRVFLGVERTPLEAGTRTWHLSHADGGPLSYAVGVVQEAQTGCPSMPQPDFLHTSLTAGAISSGSSGAPLLLPGLRIGGQLLGRCGPSAADACAVYNYAIDGAITASWPLLAPYLDPPPAGRRRSARH